MWSNRTTYVLRMLRYQEAWNKYNLIEFVSNSINNLDNLPFLKNTTTKLIGNDFDFWFSRKIEEGTIKRKMQKHSTHLDFNLICEGEIEMKCRLTCKGIETKKKKILKPSLCLSLTSLVLCCVVLCFENYLCDSEVILQWKCQCVWLIDDWELKRGR